MEIHVSPRAGSEGNGSVDKPFQTPQQAQIALRRSGALGRNPVSVILHQGTHYLETPLVFTEEDSGGAEALVTWRGEEPGQTILSGGRRLNLEWGTWKGKILKARVPEGLFFDQLFIGGRRQVLARYPNLDPSAACFEGCAEDAWAPQRAKRWKNPVGGFLHAMHPGLWGDFHYQIKGVDESGEISFEGGWQNNRQAEPHKKLRFVENLLEELDAPGEWFLDTKGGLLYYWPIEGMDLSRLAVEVPCLKEIVSFRGNERAPVAHVRLENLVFTHTSRTFMETREPLLRSDWTIYRGGAVFITGAEQVGLRATDFAHVGGNAVFVSGYNRQISLSGMQIHDAGASAVCFVGEPGAVRSPLFEYAQENRFETMDRAPGPKSHAYPADCRVEDALITRCGRFEKQSAGVQISMAQDITARHLSIFEVPRAGINIGDGCWGGHLIEHCDVFDTVLETGDHGSFNSWGRDRYWHADREVVKDRVARDRGQPFLDAVKPITLRQNRFRCDHGWDIDLDDGSTNYLIEKNLCLGGGIKNREGFGRVVRGNVIVNNSYHPHVWYPLSGDRFEKNIVFSRYFPIRLKDWGEKFDDNFLHGQVPAGPAKELQEQSRQDLRSLGGDALFLDPANGDFRVSAESPALALGFENFPMDDFGVVSPRLRALAGRPLIPEPRSAPSSSAESDDHVDEWLSAKVKNLVGLGELSAAALHEETGVLIVAPPTTGRLAKAGLRSGDVILGLGGEKVARIADLRRQWPGMAWKPRVVLEIWRDSRLNQYSI